MGLFNKVFGGGNKEPKEERVLPWKILNDIKQLNQIAKDSKVCLLYTSPSPRDKRQSRMPSSA